MEYLNLNFYKPHEPKTVLVTGAGGRLGTEVARVFLHNGWKGALLCHRNCDRAEALAVETGADTSRVRIYNLDLAEKGALIQKTVSRIEKDFGGIDAIIHCASPRFELAPSVTASFDVFNRFFKINVGAFLDIVSACWMGMKYKQSGVIVGVLSEGILKERIPGWAAYDGAKMALASYLKNLSFDVQPVGLRVMGVLPGAFKMEDSADNPTLPIDWPPETLRLMKSHWPLGIEPSKVATFIYQMVDDEEKYKNGSFHAFNAHEGERDVSRFGFFENQAHREPERQEVTSSVVTTDSRFFRELKDVFCEVFSLDDDEDVRGSQLGSWAQWDSLKHIDLLMSVENRFGINFSDSHVTTLTSFVEILETVRQLKKHD